MMQGLEWFCIKIVLMLKHLGRLDCNHSELMVKGHSGVDKLRHDVTQPYQVEYAMASANAAATAHFDF